MTQQLVEDIKSAFEQFKAHNDARLVEIEKGLTDPLTIEAVNKANTDITEIQSRLDEEKREREQLKNVTEELETRVNRSMRNGGKKDLDDATIKRYANWQGAVQNRRVSVDDVDLELINKYNAAFNEYLTLGEKRASSESISILNEMSVGSDPDGGYWVSPDVSGRLAQLIYESSPVRQVASVTSIGTDALEGGTDLDEAGFGWVGEKEARPATDTPQVGEWRIPVHEQYAMPEATQKVLDDTARDVEGWLMGKVTARFGRGEATAFVLGNGEKQPRGFTTYTAGTPSKSTWDRIQQVNIGHDGSTLGANSADKFITLAYSIKSALRAGSIFGMARLTEAEVRKIKDGEGNYLWQPDYTRLGAATLLGFPVVEMTDMPAIASNALSVVFGNFAEGYQIVDRAGVRMLRDPYTKKGFVRFYTTRRVGGGVVNFEALKLGKIAS